MYQLPLIRDPYLFIYCNRMLLIQRLIAGQVVETKKLWSFQP